MYNTQDVANRIKLQLKETGTSTKEMLSSLGMGINSISEFAKGKQMSCISLAKIADYLGCSVDYLLGRSDSPTGDTAAGGAPAGDAAAASASLADIDYDLMERRIIERYRVADDISKAMVLRALGLEEEEKEGGDVKVTA